MTDTAAPAAAARDRKLEHIELAADERMQMEHRYFDDWVLPHEALPEFALDDVDLRVGFLGKTLRAPLLVSCMTGGTGAAARINRNLAAGAERAGIALGVGSQRKAIEDPETAASFLVRQDAPTVPVVANLGAVQLNYGFGLAEHREAVEMVGADALALHLNPLQEAIQPEGQTDFRDLLPKIAEVVRGLDVPVFAKEIGCGLTAATARKLRDAGVRIIDVAGTGGTSWARIEAARAAEPSLGELFADWGVPTPESIRQIAALDGVEVIGSGGVRNGLDVAKALALGASVVGLAKPFLDAAMESADAVAARIERLVRELRIAMFCCGARTPRDLTHVDITHRPRVTRFAR